MADAEIEEVKKQLYIITGVLAGAILIVFLFVVALIIRLERERKQRIANEARFLTNADPKIRKGEEMDKRGYSMYKGVPGQPQLPPQRTSSLVTELREYQRDSHGVRPSSSAGYHGHHADHHGHHADHHGHHAGHGRDQHRDRDHRRH